MASVPVRAAADPESRVVVVRAPNQTPTAQEAAIRLRAELVSSGFEVVTVDAGENEDPRESVETREVDAIAALSIVDTKKGAAIDVWVGDRLSHKTSVRRVVSPPSRSLSSRDLAIQAVELLRTSLSEVAHTERAPPAVEKFVESRPTEIATAPEPAQGAASPPTMPAPPAPSSSPPSPPSPPPASRPPRLDIPQPFLPSTAPPRPAEPRRPFHFDMGIGFAALVHFDGNPPSLGPELTGRLSFLPQWMIRADLFGPLGTWPRRRPEGSISLLEGLFGLGVGYAFVNHGPVIPSAYLDLGAEVAHGAGSALPPYRTSEKTTAAFATMPGASIDFKCNRYVSLFVDARVSFAYPGTILRIVGHEVGTAGFTSLMTSAGIYFTP